MAELGLTDQVDFLTASLAKAFAYRAGAILCRKEVAQSFLFTAFPAIFSSALLNHELDSKATLDVIKGADDKRKNLFIQSEKLRAGLRNAGYRIQSRSSKFIAFESGNDENTGSDP